MPTGPAGGRSESRRGHRWGRTSGPIGFHGGKIEVERPRVRAPGGQEIVLSELGAGGDGRLAWPWAMKPDAAQCFDAQVRARVAVRGRRRAGPGWLRVVEVGRIPAIRGAVDRALAGVDGTRSFGPRHPGDPDRRHPHY